MWKLLSGLAALFGLLAAVFAYMNYNTFRLESVLAQRADTNLKAATEHKANADTVQATKNVNLTETEAERDQAKTQAAEKKAEADDLEAQGKEVETQLADTAEELTEMEAALDKVGDVKIVQEKLSQLETELLDYEEKIASYKSLQAVALQEREDTGRDIQSYRKLVSDQSSGKMPGISARIDGVIPQFGFVVINAGNSRGVVEGARFDVIRGGSKIGEVVVENVEPGRSVANIDKSTVGAGVTIQAGDSVSVSGSSRS